MTISQNKRGKRTSRTVSPLVLWTLRLLVRGNTLTRLSLDDDQLPKGVCDLLELPGTARLRTPAGLKRLLRPSLQRAERSQFEPDALVRNVEVLANVLHLTPVEREVLAFVATFSAAEGFDALIGSSRRELHADIATALGRDLSEIARALARSGTLRSSRLIVTERESFGPFYRHRPTLALPSWLDEILDDKPLPEADLIGHALRTSPETSLTTESFGHMKDAVDLVVRIAQRACRERTPGVNFLFHGAPGTGKTELARAIARKVDAKLYVVPTPKDDGDDRSRRIDACAFAQRILNHAPGTMLVFDEAEDAFPVVEGLFGLVRGSTSDKEWTHRLLENNTVPTVWILNQADHIDPATLRRFDVVVEFRTPPLPIRRSMVSARLADTAVGSAWAHRLAADERVSPAHVEKAAKLATLIGDSTPEALERSLSVALEASLAFVGPRRITSAANSSPTPYDLAYSNTSIDLDVLARALAKRPSATICLYGPPGTGKTAFVTHLAERVGRQIRAAKASDLLGPHVGETEQKIADLFRQASKEDALLFLDEADSLLRDRSNARQSWEVTQVNELLVQIEQFEGLLVCATNLIDTLDAASLRRFAIKVRFEPLRTGQALALFAAAVTVADYDARFVRAELEAMPQLTPGDFAAVVRRLRLLSDDVLAEALLAGLKEENSVKRIPSRAVLGFRP